MPFNQGLLLFWTDKTKYCPQKLSYNIIPLVNLLVFLQYKVQICSSETWMSDDFY